MSEINLGVSASEKYDSEPCCVSGPDLDRILYPTFHYCGKKDLDLPVDGELKIRFHKCRETTTTEEDGDERYECTIEVRAILDVEGGVQPPASSRDEAGDALDAIRELLEKGQ